MPASCPSGKIRRKSYSRKSRSTGRRTKVKSACVPDKGKPGRTPSRKRILPKPGTKIHLSTFGYSTTANAETRHKALLKASKVENPLSILRRLNNIRNLQATGEKAKEVMAKDVEWMSKEYKKMKKSSR